MRIFFGKTLSNTEVMKKLSETMPRKEYKALTSQILSLAENDANVNCGQVLNFVA